MTCKKYGRVSVRIRNKLIIEDSDHVMTFWYDLSKGTYSSIQLAKKLKILTYN